MSERLDVLVVDDSAFMRRMVTSILENDPGIRVLGQAKNGQEGLEMALRLGPDVITLDVEMPVMNGFEALRQIMNEKPTPVVMLSSLTKTGAEETMKCLSLGAVDFVAKPSGSISLDIENVAEELVHKVKAAAGSKFSHAVVEQPAAPARPARRFHGTAPKLIFIAASTGGPRAIPQVTSKLPRLGVPVVIVQHMPAGFTKAFAERLNMDSTMPIREAREGDRLEPDTVLIAPGGSHLHFSRDGVAVLGHGPTVNGVKPSADVTLASLLPLFGSSIMGVVLTGMGRDGAETLKHLRQIGGHTVAESAETCVVYGMPRAAVENGAAEVVLPLYEIADEISRACGLHAREQIA